MNYTEKQSVLLTETRTPAHIFQYAMIKKRGREYQRTIASRIHGTARSKIGKPQQICKSVRPNWSKSQPVHLFINSSARRVSKNCEQALTSSQTKEYDIATEKAQESLDPECTYYIQEIKKKLEPLDSSKPSQF